VAGPPKDLTKDAKDKGKDVSLTGPGAVGSKGASPPAKYAKTETTDLTFAYKGGVVTKDLVLSK
jgi:hypothetical protein